MTHLAGVMVFAMYFTAIWATVLLVQWLRGF
jgi:hypothetical protein